MHMQGNVRVLLNETADDRRQRIPRLSVGCGNTQIALALVAEFLGNFLDALNPPQDLSRLTNNDFAARRDSGQMLAAAGKHFQPQFVLQQANLFRDTGLRRKEALGGCGHIQIVMRNFPDIAQLL